MKKILSVLLAICTVLTTLCIPPAPVTAQSTEPLASAQIEEAITLPIEEEPISLETLTEDCKILQYVDEEAFTAADHAFRLPYLEELDTYVFQNTDGTRSIYYLYENVKYIDEQGNIREKDNTLRRETKGFRITENEFDLLLPHAVTDGVELTYQDYDVKLVPATEGKLTATAPGALQDNSVVYESFYGAGTSLVYTPLLSGVKEEIILEKYLPNKSFSFLLYTDGLFLNNTDGSYILTESKTATEAVLYLGNIVVYDAIGRPSLGNLTVETVKDGNIYALTVSADEEFLSDPATVYPVTIDPDLTISDTDNGSGAIEDTTIFSGTPNLNAGDWVRNTAGYVDETYGAGRILVRLPGLYNSERFQNLTSDRILSAIFYTTKSSSKTPDYVNLYRCTDYTWGEATATWNNAANLYAAEGSLGTSSASSSVVAFNITSLVRAWRNYYLAPSAGFMLINQNETDVNKKFGIYSSEYSNNEKRPYVVMTYDIDISLNKSVLTLTEGNSENLIATTNPSGLNVLWNSSNQAVATVTSTGFVVAGKAGTTVITASYVDSDNVTHSAQCTVYVALEDGIYCFDNEYASYRVGLVSPAAYQAGAALYETPGISSLPTERHQFFKVTYLGAGLYSIRSMLDVTLGWEHGGYNPTCEEIGTSKTTVPLDAQWYISYDSGGDCYSIYGNTGLGVGDMSRTLTCTGNVELIPRPGLQGYSSSNAMQDWQITKLTYSGSGIELRRKTSYLAVGDSFTFTATVYSSHPDEFGQGEITWSVVNGSVHASISVDGVLEVISVGTASVKAAYVCSTGAPVSTEKTVYIIPFPDGIYFLNNREKGGYIQPDNNAANYSVSGTHLEHHEFDGEDYQKWRLVSLNNGYYKILSVESGLALSVESGDEASMDVDLVQEPYVGAARQQWQFIATSANAYKIKAKSADGSNPELVICANAGTDSGTNIQQDDYESNSSYKDEWKIIYTEISLDTPLIAQQTNSWCWAASAQMMARTLFPTDANNGNMVTILEEQRKAVYRVKSIEHFFDSNATFESYDWVQDPEELANKGGTYLSVAKAAAYLCGLEGGEISFSGYATPYDIDVLLHFLSDGYPVARLYGWARITQKDGVTITEFRDLLQGLDVELGGHVSVIQGVTWNDTLGAYEFTVFDPWPVNQGAIKHFTYEELLYQVTSEEGVLILSVWFPTAVVKTEYSGKTFLADVGSSDYSSVNQGE